MECLECLECLITIIPWSPTILLLFLYSTFLPVLCLTSLSLSFSPPGCEELASQFLSQEIDGQALLLLKEEHLMTTMNIKLGPALKICAHINNLRDWPFKRSHKSLFWAPSLAMEKKNVSRRINVATAFWDAGSDSSEVLFRVQVWPCNTFFFLVKSRSIC